MMRRLAFVLSGVITMALSTGCWAADRAAIEACAYADSAAVARAWLPGEQSSAAALASERTPDGTPALSFTCEMARLEQRAYWDRAVNLNLSRYSKVSFWMKVTGGDAAIASCTLYFRSGDGWYGAPFGLGEAGWNRVTLDRSQFLPEDKPAGWNAIRGARLSFWRGAPVTGTVLVGPIEASSADVVIVRNARAGEEYASWAERMATLLTAAGVESGAIDDADVETGALAGKRLVIYPNNTSASPTEAEALRRYVAQGGKVIACYGLPPALAELLSVQVVGYARAEPEGRFSEMRAVAGAKPKLPKSVKQSSWNITRAKPIPGKSVTLSEWFDNHGKPTGEPAIVAGKNGAFVTHVLLDDDLAGKVKLIGSLLAEYAPSVWAESARRAVDRAFTIFAAGPSPGATISRMRSYTFGRAYEHRLLLDDLKAAEDELAMAREALVRADYSDALEHAGVGRPRLLRAYARQFKPKADEFRAVWCHSPFGVDGLTWDQAAKTLADNGFTAVVPNMLWAGLAHYKSDLLPVDPSVAKKGDQIAACLAACRKVGLQVHVWKVNWNLSNAPAAFVDKMRSERRLQADNAGKEAPWLCPSNPSNFELERDTMLEVARKYRVDGIHFDYIRYPDYSKCYCAGCRQRFEAKAGAKVASWPTDVLKGGPFHSAYQQFRRDNINRVVQAVSEGAKREGLTVKVSAAVFPNWPGCRDEIGQDWGLWVKNGWLDFVCPMDYTASNREYRTRVQVQRDEVAGRIPLICGVGASAPGLELAQVMQQIQISRDEKANGFIIFNYDTRTATEHIPLLGLGMTKRGRK